MLRVVVMQLAFSAIVVIPSAVWAQSHGPRENTVAIGGDVGFLASDNGSSDTTQVLAATAGTVGAFVEYYYTPRVSLRALYGWSAPAFETPPRSLQRQHVTLNFIYNWQIARLRPFAMLGGGAYFIDVRGGGERLGQRITKPGGNLGAGIEYDFRTFAVRSEMTVHILAEEERFPELRGNTLTAFTWMFGLKVPLR